MAMAHISRNEKEKKRKKEISNTEITVKERNLHYAIRARSKMAM